MTRPEWLDRIEAACFEIVAETGHADCLGGWRFEGRRGRLTCACGEVLADSPETHADGSASDG